MTWKDRVARGIVGGPAQRTMGLATIDYSRVAYVVPDLDTIPAGVRKYLISKNVEIIEVTHLVGTP